MGNRKYILLLIICIILSLFLLITISNNKKINPAYLNSSIKAEGIHPKYGCVYLGLGGTYTWSAITNITFLPEITCIDYRPISPFGAMVEIYNNCTKEIIINGSKLKTGFNYVELIKDNSKIGVKFSDFARATYIPNSTEYLKTDGTLGNSSFQFSYIIKKVECNLSDS